MTDDDIEELRRKTDHGSRIDEESDAAGQQELVETMLDELATFDEGERQKTVSVWDGDVAALVAALEEHDQIADVGQQLADAHGVDIETKSLDRSDVLRLALRHGFQHGAPDVWDALEDAIREHATRGL
jgi:hypothetical protein